MTDKKRGQMAIRGKILYINQLYLSFFFLVENHPVPLRETLCLS